MSVNITKLYTENPFLDTLLYSTKQLAYNCILKNEAEALKNETEETIAAAEKYIYSIEGGNIFELYDYTEDMYLEAGCSPVMIPSYIRNKNLVPEAYRETLIAIAKKNIIDNYEEKNNYYRKIMGLPPYKELGIPISPYLYLIPGGDSITVSYVHELGASGGKMLEQYDVIKAIKEDYPDADYLDYMSAGITPYKARKCVDKQILCLKSCGIKEIDDIFQEKFELARTYVANCVDSDAMRYDSEHYNAFLCIYILLLSITDTVMELQEHIVKKDILDARCIKYIFDIYGVPYYQSIPIKYQTIMCKNINALVQYKSSPQEMLQLITLFQADDIHMKKYYLLRDRKRDEYGDFIYNKTEWWSSIHNDIIVNETDEKLIVDTSKPYEIPYPFLYFLNKGNILWVWLDDIKLQEGKDYIIYDYNKIEFLTHNTGMHKVRIEFYYDKTTIDSEYTPNTEDSLKMHHQYIDEGLYPRYKYNLDLPYPDYLNDGNDVIVFVNTVAIHPSSYIIDKTNNTIEISSGYNLVNRKISFIYLYGSKVTSKFEKHTVTSPDDGTDRFTIPEPFPHYVSNGNEFFINVGTMYIDRSRYTISDDGTQIKFIDGYSLARGKDIAFNFIYSDQSRYEELTWFHSSETIIATTTYQLEFKLNMPIPNYYKRGLHIYVELLGWYIDDTQYDFYGDTLRLRYLNMGLQPGDTITIHYYYTPVVDNVMINHLYISTTEKYQRYFTIQLPTDRYFKRGNQLLIDSAGIPLREGTDYTIYDITDTDCKIDIINPDYRPYIKKKLGIEYVYIKESDYAIKITQKNTKMSRTEDNKVFLDVPFYPYLETGHRFIAAMNSSLIPDSAMQYENYSPWLTLDPDLTRDRDDQITFLYIYTNKYYIDRANLLKVSEVTIPASDANDSGTYNIPEPFEDYVINDWPWFLDSSNKWQAPNKDYDVVNQSVAFVDNEKIKDNTEYTFTFIYKDSEPWVIKNGSEDLENDFSLEFLKLPLDAFTNTDDYIKLKENTKAYDLVTLADHFWDGEFGATSPKYSTRHAEVKADILKLEINYVRTKYLSVDYLMDVSEMAFQIPYFYNMLWDDVFQEELLEIEIPNIISYHKFKLSHLFCYMTALMYIFKNVDDTIMDSPTKILYAKGFNFKTDLNDLKTWILDKRRLPRDYDVFDFYNPNGQYPDIPSFIDTYKNNLKVYKTITHAMANADDYDIWCIWKKMYDSLMIWQFNLEYFKLSNGTVARSFTDFLYEKDIILYQSLDSIRSIEDQTAKENTIIETIQDIVYLLDTYIDSKEFKFIYDQFPGVSQRHLLEYLFLMINFFKSYKVVLDQMTVDFNITDPDDSYIKPIDVKNLQVYTKKIEYADGREKKSSQNYTLYSERIFSDFREHLSIEHTY